jgi:signal transduction histidine kinase
VDRLSGLVDRLLTLSRAESGQAKLSVEVVDLGELAEEVVGHLGVLAEEKRQTMTVEVVGAPRGLGDRVVLRQSLINLVDNAIKYTPSGGSVRVTASRDGDSYGLRVTDSGRGIPPEAQARIFERFFRAQREWSPLASNGAGAGLGLAIAKWIAERHGGRLSLVRSDESGSEFSVVLPRKA